MPISVSPDGSIQLNSLGILPDLFQHHTPNPIVNDTLQDISQGALHNTQADNTTSGNSDDDINTNNLDIQCSH